MGERGRCGEAEGGPDGSTLRSTDGRGRSGRGWEMVMLGGEGES